MIHSKSLKLIFLIYILSFYIILIHVHAAIQGEFSDCRGWSYLHLIFGHRSLPNHLRVLIFPASSKISTLEFGSPFNPRFFVAVL